MTREATSQGRRGGIFLASRVFFLAMFAVVALRSTTVLATMESVSGDTAVDHGGDVAHIRGRKLTQQTGPYTYDFIVNAVNDWGSIGPIPYYVKLDGVMPSVDQFTVHVAPDREFCAAGTGGSCVAGVAGFIDGDEFTQSNWEKASSTAGTLLFSITTTVRVSKIEIKYHRPVYEPGWLIKENGVEVYRKSTNGGSDMEPSPVTYTYDLATKFALVDISSTISSGDYKFGGVATASNGKTSSRHIKRTAWECLTRATTASCWWTSHRPSLLT